MNHFIGNFNERFWQLRGLLEKQRLEFKKEFGFSVATIRKWETLPDKGFNSKVLARYIQIYKHLGVNVTYEWLVTGQGDIPKVRSFMDTVIDNTANIMIDHPVLPFFFLYDNELIVRKINPKFSYLLSMQPVEQMEGAHLSTILSKESFIIQQQIFKDAANGIHEPYKLYTPTVIDNKIDLSLVCHVVKNHYLTIGAFNYIASGLLC